ERLAGSPGSMAAALRWNMTIDIRAIVPAIRVPTLIVHRVKDALIPVETSRDLARLMPHAKYVELEGSEHYAFLGDVDAVVDEVENFLTGTRRHADADRQLATVLFTDIVGSTEKVAELGDRRWHALLEEHHHRVRRELDTYRGKEVKTTGDG